MFKRLFILFSISFGLNAVHAQKDSVSTDAIMEANINYDELFSELDNFLDSLLAPRNFTLINVSGSNRSFTYKRGNKIEREKHLNFTPSLGFYSKTGLGINATASVMSNSNNLEAFQYTLTGSYDFLNSFDFATGIAATHFFTKKDVTFYTSPLENELYTYFTYREWWIKPTVSARYGWGSQTSYRKRESIITSLLPLPVNGSGGTTTTENISDFITNISLRHDFYYRDVFSKKCFIRFTPQASVTAGKQNYGFNQNNTAYGLHQIIQNNFLQPMGPAQVTESTKFGLLSAAASLRTELNIGKFFIQPQIVFDYYLPGNNNHINTMFNVNTGVIL